MTSKGHLWFDDEKEIRISEWNGNKDSNTLHSTCFSYLFLNNNPEYQKTAEKCSFIVRKVIFAHDELMFAVREHMFMGGEHKFVGHEYKIDVWQIKKSP